MEKTVIGFAGKIASGKSSLAKWLSEPYGFKIISISEPIYLISEALYNSVDRHLLVNISKKLKKRDKLFWLYYTVGKIMISQGRYFVIDDIRFIEEIKVLRECCRTVIILLKVDAPVAWQRVQQRGSKKDLYRGFEEFLTFFNGDNEVDLIESRGLFDLAIDTTSVDLEREKRMIERFLKSRGIL